VNPLTSDTELVDHFTGMLKSIVHSFKHSFSNEAMARCYINPMHTAVDHVMSTHPSLTLSVEQDFDGSHGYGNLDYVVFCYELVVLVTEAKLEKMSQGLAQYRPPCLVLRNRNRN